MANGLRLRKEVAQLDPTELDALRDAYRKMMALSATDNRGWMYWAGFHGFPNWLCWHHGRVGMGLQQAINLFLPWHRAYLLYFELAAQDKNVAATVPWWDWTSARSHPSGVPPAFSEPSVAGQPNPLFSGPVPRIQNQPARQTRRFPGSRLALPTTSVVDNLLRLSSFTDFTSQLEDVHDAIHGWAGGRDPNNPTRGGDMGGVVTAAYDPIFWSHHCMIDRIWYLWQLTFGINNIPSAYLSLPLRPFDLTVSDVLDISRLGYEYAVADVAVVGPR